MPRGPWNRANRRDTRAQTMPAFRKEKDYTEHPEHENANHPAGPKHLKDMVLRRGRPRRG
jgi:hypothetical protein